MLWTADAVRFCGLLNRCQKVSCKPSVEIVSDFDAKRAQHRLCKEVKSDEIASNLKLFIGVARSNPVVERKQLFIEKLIL